MIFVSYCLFINCKLLDDNRGDKYYELFEMHSLGCLESLSERRAQLRRMIFTFDQQDCAGYEAIESTTLLSVIIGNLLEMSSSGGKFDLTQMYTERTADMVSKTVTIQIIVRHRLWSSVVADNQLPTLRLRFVLSRGC